MIYWCESCKMQYSDQTREAACPHLHIRGEDRRHKDLGEPTETQGHAGYGVGNRCGERRATKQ